LIAEKLYKFFKPLELIEDRFMLILKDKKRKDLKTGVISLVSLMILGQTTTNTSSIDPTIWFSGFLPLIVHLFMAFAIIMFIYAIIEAPLEIFKRRSVSLSLLTFLFLGQTTTDRMQELVSKAMEINNVLSPLIAYLLVIVVLIAIPILVFKVIASDIFDIIKK
jgi:hypothetical protein